VLPAVQRLAAMSDVSEDEAKLLEVAAACHDLGFVVQRQEHERIGAELAADLLPAFGFSAPQIAAVQGMIMATQLPQSPQTPLEEILADADLDVLGREDFLARNEALRAEMAASGVTLSEEQWIRTQLRVLENHHYFTGAAKRLRGEGKRKNITMMKERLARITGQATKGGGSDDRSQ
jgi:predicted metal-dependent HD superfamily phosphohydrolase